MRKLILLLVLTLGFSFQNAQAQTTCNAFFQYTLGACPTVSFFDGSNSTPGNITDWFWDFGDGQTSSAQNPQNTYAANGTYLTCLTIMTSDSCVSTYCDTLIINCIAPPGCQAFYQYTLGACPMVSFFDGSTSNPGNITSWSWDFGNGDTGLGQNPSYTYTANGSYLVCLTILTNDGCSSTYCDTLSITCLAGAPTCSTFFQYTLGGCPNVSFFDNSVASPGNISEWAWNFGDGGTATTQNPTHTYTANGMYAVCLTTTSTDSCVTTYCDTLNITCIQATTCNADFVYNSGNCPFIAFGDNSSSSPGNITNWFWDFGDGNTSTQQSPLHTYGANGSYLACLTITTSDSCTSTYCDTVVIGCIGTPTCNANFGHTFANCPNIMFFDASSASGTIIDWFWDFGDGGTATTQSPTHNYTANGTYTACLTITTSDSCTSTYCDAVVITCIQSSTCNADFAYNTGNCPLVAFSDASTSSPFNIVDWIWDFGDGNTSTQQSPTHNYTANGNYIVCLTIITADSCSSTHCDTVAINCIGNPTCNTVFQYTLGGCPDISFFDFSSSSPGFISEWVWNFGDGGTSTVQNPMHTYTANGNYTVCLTTTSTDSCVSTYCIPINITCVQSSSCNADFIYNTGNCPFVSFVDASSSSPFNIVDWIWDFGDGNTSTQQNPTHNYTANGNYIVCLTIITSDSCTSTYCDTVAINCITSTTCNAQFQYTLGACPTISFFDGSFSTPSPISEWAWDFGDGNTSTVQNPTHTYGVNGSYQVCLTITTTDSCVSTFCDVILINCIQCPPPVADFTYTSNGLTHAFTDASTSTVGINSWIWDFGDGNVATSQNPTHTYANAGLYLVCLTVSDSCGTATYCDSLNVTPIGFEELFEEAAPTLSMHPNPSNGNFTLKINGNEMYNVTIFNAIGQEIESLRLQGNTTRNISLENARKGVYFIRVTDNEYTITKRMVIR